MKIKRQLSLIYLYEGISALKMVDMVWVLFLVQRGFTLTDVGIAEGFFHGVSMCCEIPSGMLADLLGRKRTLVLSGILSFLSSLCMVASKGMGLVLVSMGLNALSYNLVSGTREALTYDSLLEVGCEDRYLKTASIQEMIYQGLSAAACLTAVLAVTVGYQKAYGIAAVQSLLAAGTAGLLREPKAAENRRRNVPFPLFGRELLLHIKESVRFFRGSKRLAVRMVFSGLSSAGCYLMYMMMQEHFVAIGVPEQALGMVLFLISTGAILGAFLGGKKKAGLFRTLIFSGLCCTFGILFSGSRRFLLALAAAWIAHLGDEITMLCLEEANQRIYESKIRATMISVESMVRSILMCLLSPLVGMIAQKSSMMVSMAVLGGVLFWVFAVLLTLRNEDFRDFQKK